jgi:glycine cleavage system transcriptional repressor
VSTLAVTVIGRDRPGIIAEVTAVLARVGMNLEDSTMTLLRGHFAWVLVAAGPPSAAALDAALAPVTADGSLLIWVREVPADVEEGYPGQPFVVSVHGGDRPGIVSLVAATLAAAGGNITDLTTRLVGGLYVAVAEVTLPVGADAGDVARALAEVGRHLSVDVTIRPQESDVL